MPHIIVKLWQGRSEDVKKKLADDVANAVSKSLNTDISNVSVGIEEYDPKLWDKEVVEKDIENKKDTIYVLPGNMK